MESVKTPVRSPEVSPENGFRPTRGLQGLRLALDDSITVLVNYMYIITTCFNGKSLIVHV